MAKLVERLSSGLVSARWRRRELERAVKKEWQAMRTAEQDRAHLATLARAPAMERRAIEAPAAPSLSREPSPGK